CDRLRVQPSGYLHRHALCVNSERGSHPIANRYSRKQPGEEIKLMKHSFMFGAMLLMIALAGCLDVPALASGKQEQKSNNREAKAVAAVRAVLDAQVAAWNRGDIEGFMDGYW